MRCGKLFVFNSGLTISIVIALCLFVSALFMLLIDMTSPHHTTLHIFSYSFSPFKVAIVFLVISLSMYLIIWSIK